jgi:hypothetical protein
MVRRLGPGLMIMAAAACAATAGPGPATERSVAAQNDDPAVGCAGGSGDACGLLGMSRFLEARARGHGLESALAPFRAGCAADDWFGCAMAAVLASSAHEDPAELAGKAFSLAGAACDDGESGACIYLADWAARAGDRDAARGRYATACARHLACGAEDGLGSPSCSRAVELGADPVKLGEHRRPAGMAAPFRRTAGETQVQPPPGVRQLMCERGMERLTVAVALCLSAAGVPRRIYFASFSGVPWWDQRLFETIRAWRYTPRPGQPPPPPVCFDVTFHYQPTCEGER